MTSEMFGDAPATYPTGLKTIIVCNAIIATKMFRHAALPAAYWTWLETIIVFNAIIPELCGTLLWELCVPEGFYMRSSEMNRLNVLFVITRWKWVIESDGWDVLTCITTGVYRNGWTEEHSRALVAEVRSPWDALRYLSLFSKKTYEA